MEDVFAKVLIGLYVAGLAGMVTSAFKFPDVYEVAEMAVRWGIVLVVAVFSVAIITVQFTTIPVIQTVAEVSPEAARAALAIVKPWKVFLWVPVYCVLAWLILVATTWVKNTLEDKRRGAANQAGGHDGKDV